MNKLLNIVFTNQKITIYLFIIISLISLTLISNLKINTSTDSLINKNLDFKKNQKKLKDSFKVLNNNILIRIKGKNYNEVKLASEKLVNKLNNLDGLSFVFSPNLDKNLKKNFFLFLNDSEKDSLIQKLYESQPFLSQINNHQDKLEGFNNILDLTLKSDSKEDKDKFSTIFKIFNESLALKKKVEWTNILSSQNNEFFILFGLSEKFLEKNSFEVIYDFLTNFKSNQKNGIEIDYTGGLLIDYEEIGSVSGGVSLSGLLSFILVAILLWLAFKDLYLLLSIIFTIILGLVITLGITTLVIGSLNLISVAFAVLFIGLSVDYGIQICSRIKEKNFIKNNIKEKTKIVESIGRILFIASIPSIVGFLSFIPTDYVGLSELGIISAIGLLVGLILNIFFLPCLLELILKKKKLNFISLNSNRYENLLFQNKNQILIIFLIIAIYSFFNMSKITFDSDALNLKDQDLQSVKLAKELIENNPTSDYVASVIFTEKEFEKFRDDHPIFQSDIVNGYFSYKKIFEKYESEDLYYLKFLLSNKKFKRPSDGVDQLTRLNLLLDEYIQGDFGQVSLNAKLLKNNIAISQNNEISKLDIQEILFENFDDLISFVLNLGSIPENLYNQIPQNFSKRYLSDDNLYRIEIFPSRDLSKPRDLEQFVSIVENYFPSATGMPIVQFNAGKIVVDSFKKALLISLLFLIVFLFFIFKKLNYVLLCISSLFCAFILTIFFMIILKLNLNFANMIAIPLLFSLGVSYPIYFIKRFEELGDFKKLFSSNTPIAILFSGLTTIFSFSTLYLSSHNGTSSMGLLLFISLSNTLVTSLILLPIFIKIFKIK